MKVCGTCPAFVTVSVTVPAGAASELGANEKSCVVTLSADEGGGAGAGEGEGDGCGAGGVGAGAVGGGVAAASTVNVPAIPPWKAQKNLYVPAGAVKVTVFV